MIKLNIKVSVIIPSYKRPEKTKKALDSVLLQTFSAYEIIIVDDNGKGSSDQLATEKIISDYLKKNNKRKTVNYIIHKINKGGGIARNTGAEVANGVLLAFLDSDDTWRPKKLELIVKAYNSNKKDLVGFFYHKEITFDSNTKVISGDFPSKNPIAQQLVGTIATTSSLVIPHDVFKKVKGFRNLPSSQEVDLILRILAAGYEPKFINSVLTSRDLSAPNRISTNKKNSDNSWLTVRLLYFNLVDKKTKKIVMRKFYTKKMSMSLSFGKRIDAIKYFILSICSQPSCWYLYLRSIQLILPASFTKSLYPKVRRLISEKFKI